MRNCRIADPREALTPDAVQVHEGGNLICRYVTKAAMWMRPSQTQPHVLEREYTTQRVQHVAMEPEVC
jgi:CO/xanthine dehydrogenase Mo-binding subunit